MFTRRNIHFAAACAAGAKARLSNELKGLIALALPDKEGMVRLSNEPPGGMRCEELPLDKKFIDVPAADLGRDVHDLVPIYTSDALLIVPLDHRYTTSGNGVVSTRTAEHVGYNGLAFRGKAANPEPNGYLLLTSGERSLANQSDWSALRRRSRTSR